MPTRILVPTGARVCQGKSSPGEIIMVRLFLVVLAAGIAALLAGFIYLGAAPPKPHVQEMHVVLPNDRFGNK